MKLLACLLIFFFAGSAYSQQKMSGEEFSEKLQSKCRLKFDENVVGKMENTGINMSEIDGRNYFSAEFTMKIRDAKNEVPARVAIYCSEKNNSLDAPRLFEAPREQIEQEDSGRYYRHVAWQRNATGINWKGQVAYADALHGDGTVLPIDFYLVCLRAEGNPCIHIDVRSPRPATRKVRSAIMKMIGRIEHFE